MNSTRQYYSIRFMEGNAFHAKDDVLNTSEKVLNIGEYPDCPIRYETSEGYEPEYYATIIKNEDSEGWRIVKRSQFIDVVIAGNGGFGYVHQLKDGDIIGFGDGKMALQFNLHHDGDYSDTGIKIVHQSNHRLLYAMVALVCLVTAGVGYLLYDRWNQSDLHQDVKVYSSSVYIIMADSVQLVKVYEGKEEQIGETKDLAYTGEREIGTAFLTTEGKLVTARHCIEFWLNRKISRITNVEGLNDDDIVKWAIKASTYMNCHEEQKDTVMALKTYCSVYNPDSLDSPLFVFHSMESRVHINRVHDIISTIPDYSGNYYWRSIIPRSNSNDREAELGDIAYIDVGEKGTIVLADSMRLSNIAEGTDIVFLGFPQNGIGDRTLMYEDGKITREVAKDGISQNLYVKGEINPGFSGGPVMARINNKIVAIGVTSRVDSISNGVYKWVVPVSEIAEMRKREEATR